MPSRRHRSIGREPADTAEAIAERLLHRAALELLELERAQLWAELTPEAAPAMLAWQERRLLELKAELRPRPGIEPE